MGLFSWLKKKQKHKPRAEFSDDGSIIVTVKVDGYDNFVAQLGEMSRLVDVLSDKLERLGELTEPITVVNNNYNLSVNAGDAEMQE